MVVLQIDGGGFQTAGTAFAEGNQLGALAFDRLTGVLAGCGGMAGDDTTSTDFCAAYDEAAVEAVAALADLIESFTRMGHLTHATRANHATANARAVVGGATVYDGGWLPEVGEDRGYVSVLPFTPPTARGATTPGLSTKIDWILDHIEGFVWPGADLTRLRRAATAWRTAAEALADLAGCCDSATRGFWLERSPEIPLAIDATADLKTQVGEVAASLASLATTCDAYADAVEAKHAEILDLAHWVLEQIVEGVIISVALGILTGGAGAGVGLSAVATKVAAQSPKFTAILDALRTLTAGYTATTRATKDTLAATRLRLVKFKQAAVTRPRDERGEVRLLWARGEGRGFLARHEHSGSHTIAKHVGKTDHELLERLRTDPTIGRSSSFPDVATAERALSHLLHANRSRIDDWLAGGGKGKLPLNGNLDFVTGRTADESGEAFQVRGVRAILVRDASMPDGFRILTAYPRSP